MTCHLRTAEPADREAVTDLIQELNVFENGLTGDRLESRAAADAYVDALHERLAKEHGRLVLAVTNDDEAQIVGLLGWAIDEGDLYLREDVRRAGIVTDLVVREAWRGRGIARLLLNEAERLTRAEGLKRLVIGVLETNRGARATYEAFGFQPYLRSLIKSVGDAA